MQLLEGIKCVIGILPNRALLLLLLLSVSGPIAHAGDWELKKNTSGIRIYTKSSTGSDIKAIKAEFEAQGTVKQLADLLADIGTQKSWVYSTASSTLIKRIGERELIYHTEKELPWPLNNRDVVMQMKWVLDTVAGTLTVNSHSTPYTYPQGKGVVRVPSSEVVWKVHTTRPNTIKIEYTAQADPAGKIPAWVANMFLTKGPYETFVALRKQLERRK